MLSSIPFSEWIAKAADVCEQAAMGNLEPRLFSIDVDGDLGRLLHGINGLLDLTDAFVRESGACLNAAGKGKFFRKIIVRGMRGCFSKSAQVANAAIAEMAHEHAILQELEQRRSVLAAELNQVISAISNSATSVRIAATLSLPELKLPLKLRLRYLRLPNKPPPACIPSHRRPKNSLHHSPK